MRARLWAWMKSEPIPALTIGGVVLYALLRVPYAVYYGSLGTSPEDVGLSYVETLARSAAGLLLAGLIVAVVAAAAGAALTVVVLYIRVMWASLTVWGIGRKRWAEMSDEEYAAERKQMERLFTKVMRKRRAGVDALLQENDQMRRIRRLGVMTAEQHRDVEQRRARGAWATVGPLVRAEAAVVARWLAAAGATATGLVIILGLPVVAYFDAQGVRDCSRPALAQYGFFAVRGARADVFRVAADGTTAKMLTDRQMMYLGTGDDRIVLFDCRAGRAVRLPAADVLVASE